MKIYCEDSLLYARDYFDALADCQFFASGEISPAMLADADALLVRSTTKVTPALIARAKRLQFVATATAGVDHLCLDHLHQRGIQSYHAAGCNANAVVQYVLCAMVYLAQLRGFKLFEKTVGIIGAGQVGSRLQACLASLGMKVYLCDPPLQAVGDPRQFCDFDQILSCDLISVHVPLVIAGEYPTYHMFNRRVLARLRADQSLINTCRGEVVDNAGLLALKHAGASFATVLDVWEQEPEINYELARAIDIATPHIAGHTLEGKANGTQMVYEALCRHFALPADKQLADYLPALALSRLHYDDTRLTVAGLASLLAQVYDIHADHTAFLEADNSAAGFRHLRRHYRTRREWQFYQLSAGNLFEPQALYGLGFAR